MNILKLTQIIMQKLGYDSVNDTININADNLSIKDSVIELNTGEEGDGITTSNGESGFIISRGPNLDPVKIIYTEADSTVKILTGSEELVVGITPEERAFLSEQTTNHDKQIQRQFTEQYLGI
jgi:hypothetical protein